MGASVIGWSRHIKPKNRLESVVTQLLNSDPYPNRCESDEFGMITLQRYTKVSFRADHLMRTQVDQLDSRGVRKRKMTARNEVIES